MSNFVHKYLLKEQQYEKETTVMKDQIPRGKDTPNNEQLAVHALHKNNIFNDSKSRANSQRVLPLLGRDGYAPRC